MREAALRENALRENASQLISMLDVPDLEKVVIFATDLIETSKSPFKPLSEQDILRGLEVSQKQAAEGNFQDFDTALEELSSELDLA